MGPRGTELIAMVAAMHIVIGFVAIFSEPAAWPTRTFDMWRIMPDAIDQYVIGLWGSVVGGTAIIGLARNGVGRNPNGWRWYMPSLFTLFLSASLALAAVFEGQFGDGEPRARSFIAADQLLTIILPFFYAYALFNRYAEGWDHFIPYFRKRACKGETHYG